MKRSDISFPDLPNIENSEWILVEKELQRTNDPLFPKNFIELTRG